jgi:hypothetical protein
MSEFTLLRDELLLRDVIDTITADPSCWDQERWRRLADSDGYELSFTRWSTTPDRMIKMCAGGLTVERTGGSWLIAPGPDGQLLLAGRPITADQQDELEVADLELVLFEEGDGEGQAQLRFGHKVVHARVRASRMLKLTGRDHNVFSANNDLDDLRKWADNLYPQS